MERNMNPPPVSEKVFMAQVIDLASICGWLVYHTHDSRRSQVGFVDLVLVRKRVLWVELKAETGTLSPVQQVWSDWLKAAEQEVYLWRPSDWDEIQKVLAR